MSRKFDPSVGLNGSCIFLAEVYQAGLLPVSNVHSADASHPEAHCCHTCICSTEPRERLGGVLAIDELIDVKVSCALLLLGCCTANGDIRKTAERARSDYPLMPA